MTTTEVPPATVLRSIARALDTTADLIHDATLQLLELAILIEVEDLDPALTGNPDTTPDTGWDTAPDTDAYRSAP